MKFLKVRRIRQFFLGILLATIVFGVVIFSSRTLFAPDAFVRTYQFSSTHMLLSFTTFVELPRACAEGRHFEKNYSLFKHMKKKSSNHDKFLL